MKMNINPTQKNIELKYETDQFQLTGEISRHRYDEQKEDWVDTVEEIDVLVQIMAGITFSERSCIDPKRYTTVWHHVDVKLQDDLKADGWYKRDGRVEPWHEYRITDFSGDHGNFDKEKDEYSARHEALGKNLAVLCRDQLPNHNSAINIVVHSEQLYSVAGRSEEQASLVGPYLVELVEKAIADAKTMIGGQK